MCAARPAMSPTSRRGFTVIEILVTLGITAVLIAIALPTYARITQRGRAAACLSNLRQIGMALNVYLGEHNLVFPELAGARNNTSQEVSSIDTVLLPYAGSTNVFACPSDARGLAESTGTSYYWNTALNNQPIASLNFLGIITETSRIPILGDKEGFHPYAGTRVNILYADGHVTKELRFFTD